MFVPVSFINLTGFRLNVAISYPADPDKQQKTSYKREILKTSPLKTALIDLYCRNQFTVFKNVWS